MSQHKSLPPAFVRATRSQLYVPANRPEWFAKAAAAGPDALILDLEDSVTPAFKNAARESAVELLRALRDDPVGCTAMAGRPPDMGVPVALVRINDADSTEFLADVTEVVAAGADGIVLPKVLDPTDIVVFDRLLGIVERGCGREGQSTLIVPLLETPSAIRDAYRIGAASSRVAYMGGMSTRDGDIQRGIGYRWSSSGAETLTFRARALLDARAAGVAHPVTGIWTDIDDLDGLRAFATQGRDLGYEGISVIHPSHVAIANEVFGPTPEELEHDRQLIEAMERAEAEGFAAARFDGHMVDIAMVKTARRRLAEAGEETRAPR